MEAPKETQIYCSVRVIQLSQIDPLNQSFKCRFDFRCFWADESAPTGKWAVTKVDPKDLEFIPNIRFPNADERDELNRAYERRPPSGDLPACVGFRSTMQGIFKCVQDLRSFPFDVQAMSIELQRKSRDKNAVSHDERVSLISCQTHNVSDSL